MAGHRRGPGPLAPWQTLSEFSNITGATTLKLKIGLSPSMRSYLLFVCFCGNMGLPDRYVRCTLTQFRNLWTEKRRKRHLLEFRENNEQLRPLGHSGIPHSRRASAEWAVARVLQPTRFADVVLGQLHLRVDGRRWREPVADALPENVGEKNQ